MKKQNDVIPLNDKLLNEFSIEELENRLETDPMFFGTLFSGMTESSNGESMEFKCPSLDSCELSTCFVGGIHAEL